MYILKSPVWRCCTGLVHGGDPREGPLYPQRGANPDQALNGGKCYNTVLEKQLILINYCTFIISDATSTIIL